ncbi:hypothetical protein VPHD148_0079 [Vibrio phage D148]
MSTLNFQKATQGSSLNFSKDLGLDFSKGLGGNIMINLNWGTNERTRSVDIDLALAVVAGAKQNPTVSTEVKKAGFFGKLIGKKDETITTTTPAAGKSVKTLVHCFDKTGARGDGIIHHGDDTSGSWADGEFIEIDVTKIGNSIQELIPSILSYSGHELSDLPFAHMKVYVGSKNAVVKPLFEVDLTNLQRGDMGAQFGKLVRSGDSWEWTTDIKKTNVAGSRGFKALKELAIK